MLTGQYSRSFQLLLLTLVTIAAFYTRTSLGPFQETMRVVLSMSANQMALLQGPPLALGFVIGIPIGILIDRHSRVRLVLVFALLGLFATALTAWAADFSTLFAARCLIGVSACTIWITVLSLLADCLARPFVASPAATEFFADPYVDAVFYVAGRMFSIGVRAKF